MATHRKHRDHVLEEVEAEIQRRLAADNEADREYTTPERLAMLRGEPAPSAPAGEEGRSPEARARAPLPGQPRRKRAAEPTPEPDFDAMLDERIREEIADFEREGGCVARGSWLREPRAVPPPATDKGEGRERRAGKGEPGRARRGEAHRERRAAAARAPRPAARIDYRAVSPAAFAAMSRLEAFVRHCGLERPLLELVELRASQLNGCASCVGLHRRAARRTGEARRRLDAVEAWRERRFFTPRERAALAWTEAVTLLGPDRVDDETLRVATRQFSEEELVNLTVAIIAVNGWNRLAIAFRAEPGPHEETEAPPAPGA